MLSCCSLHSHVEVEAFCYKTRFLCLFVVCVKKCFLPTIIFLLRITTGFRIILSCFKPMLSHLKLRNFLYQAPECHQLWVIHHIIFHSSTISEFVKIARSTLLLKDFLPGAKNLLDWMINQNVSLQILIKAD